MRGRRFTSIVALVLVSVIVLVIATTKNRSRNTLSAVNEPVVNKPSTVVPRSNQHARLKKLDFDTAKARIEHFNSENSSIEDRAKFASEIIGNMCEQGLQEEAWLLIEPTAGSVRASQITAFFAHAELDLFGASSFLERLHDTFDVGVGLDAYLSVVELTTLTNISSEDGFDKLKSVLAPHKKNDLLSTSLAYALRGKIGNIGQDELIDTSKSLFDSNLLNAQDAKEVLLPLMQSSPFEIYDKFIKDLAGKGNTKDGQGLARETISFMIGKDPVKCINELIADANNDASRNIVTGFELWTNQDAKGAYNWFIDKESSLNPAQRSAAAMGFFVRAIQSGEIDGAAQWNAYITDPRFKKTTDQVLKSKMKK